MSTLIIGNGAAANAAARTLRSSRPEENITLISGEGLVEYSPCFLPDYLAGTVKKERLFLKDEKYYRSMGINLVHERAVKINPGHKKVYTEKSTHSYANLVIAVGSKPKIPPVEGIHLKGSFTLRKLQDVEEMIKHGGKNGVVVGTGAIAIEAACALRKRGIKVALISKYSRLLPKMLDSEFAVFTEKRLADNGITIIREEKVEGIDGRGGKVSAVITDRQTLPCHLVVWCTGMEPDIEWACKSGLKKGVTGALETDDCLRTKHENIYACGDCAENRDLLTGKRDNTMLWHNAVLQGETVGYTIAGKNTSYPGNTTLFILNLFGRPVAFLGLMKDRAGRDIKKFKVVKLHKRGVRYQLTLDDGKPVRVQSIGVGRELGLFYYQVYNQKNTYDLRSSYSKFYLA